MLYWLRKQKSSHSLSLSHEKERKEKKDIKSNRGTRTHLVRRWEGGGEDNEWKKEKKVWILLTGASRRERCTRTSPTIGAEVTIFFAILSTFVLDDLKKNFLYFCKVIF